MITAFILLLFFPSFSGALSVVAFTVWRILIYLYWQIVAGRKVLIILLQEQISNVSHRTGSRAFQRSRRRSQDRGSRGLERGRVSTVDQGSRSPGRGRMPEYEPRSRGRDTALPGYVQEGLGTASMLGSEREYPGRADYLQEGESKTPVNIQESSESPHSTDVLRACERPLISQAKSQNRFYAKQSKAEVVGLPIPENRDQPCLLSTECALCLASRVGCCAMRRKSPCQFPIPHRWSVMCANVTPPSESPAKFGLFAQPGHEPALSKLCDSSCAPSGCT
ncbi:UNVERIFIED_CONTAM: hypothetical protein FKN15_066346 [Acipenser sinensis]